jgi:hypothetical protein
LESGETSRQFIFDFPEGSSAQVDVVLDQSHACISRPAFLVVVADNVFVVWVWVFREESLDQIPRFVLLKSEHDVDLVDVAHIHSYRVSHFGLYVGKGHELVGHVDWTGQFICSLQAKY